MKQKKPTPSLLKINRRDKTKTNKKKKKERKNLDNVAKDYKVGPLNPSRNCSYELEVTTDEGR